MMNRSFLFAPGNQPRRIHKALTLVAAQGRRCRGYVRVNAMGTPWCFRDLTEVVVGGVDGVVLPKVESAADLHAIDWLLANLERERGLAVGAIDLVPQIETAAGLTRIERILQARGLKPYSGRWRVKRVSFGAADYSNDVGLTPDAEERELAGARERLVLASRAAGVEPPLDSPYFTLGDAAGYAAAVARSRRMGFQGRLCIHPEQIAGANAGYAPSAEEVERARRIVTAFRAAEATGAAAIQVDGQMVDYPVAQQAERLLAAAAPQPD
jgi:citrate lyase subunit beta/citryl-CoA lyase